MKQDAVFNQIYNLRKNISYMSECLVCVIILADFFNRCLNDENIQYL